MFSLIPLPYRILIAVVLIASLSTASFIAGQRHEVAASAVREQKAVADALKANQEIKAAADAQALEQAKAQADLVAANADLTDKLTAAQAKPIGPDCRLDKGRAAALNEMLK